MDRLKNYFLARPASSTTQQHRASDPPVYSSVAASNREGNRRPRADTSPRRRSQSGDMDGSAAAADDDDDRSMSDGGQPNTAAATGSNELNSGIARLTIQPGGSHSSPLVEVGTPTSPVDAASFKFPPGESVRIRLIPYNPYFPTIEKHVTGGAAVPIGRHQRRQPDEDPNNDGIYFRSTVVSRKHAQLHFIDGEFLVKDCKSLGGTFLNSSRLSNAGKESPLQKISHGDILQFGVDYRPDARTGQVRNKDRCVEVRVEFPSLVKRKGSAKPKKWKPASHTHTDCCICLSALFEKQAIFIGPCSHSFHYRCIAPLLRGKEFSCPMCRQQSDLQASLYSLDDYDDDESGADDGGPANASQAPRRPRPETAVYDESPVVLPSADPQ